MTEPLAAVSSSDSPLTDGGREAYGANKPQPANDLAGISLTRGGRACDHFVLHDTDERNDYCRACGHLYADHFVSHPSCPHAALTCCWAPDSCGRVGL